MSKEEFLKIQTCVLKVHIHCDGCKHKVKKLLQKIEGVYTTTVDGEQGKVTVSGNIEPSTLIKKLAKSGKHAEIWGAQKATNNQNQLNNQIKNMQIDNGKGGGKDDKSQKGGKDQQPKGGQQQIPQQLQQLKGFSDMKLPQFKDLKGMMPFKDQKPGKFDMLEDDEFSDEDDDDFDDEFSDDDYDDDEFDDDLSPPPKMKPVMVNGQGANGMMNGNLPQLMKGGGGGGGGGGGNGKKGVEVPVQVKGMGGNNGNNGKKGVPGGGSGGGNQNQGGGAAKKDGKNGGGGFPQEVKNGGGGANKGANNIPSGGGGGGGNNNANGGKKGGKNDGVQVMNNMTHHGFSGMDVTHGLGGGNVGHMSHMRNFPMPQMGNFPAVQGLPASLPMNPGGGGYFQGGGAPPEYVGAGNQYQQQQYMAAMMNQQHSNGMMYGRPPPPPTAYMPPPEPYTPYLGDENTDNGCHIM